MIRNQRGGTEITKISHSVFVGKCADSQPSGDLKHNDFVKKKRPLEFASVWFLRSRATHLECGINQIWLPCEESKLRNE